MADRATMQFPDPRIADEDGLVYIGGELTPANVVAAYQQGIFPWPDPNWPLLWFCPGQRGVLDFSRLHLPRSFRRWLRKQTLRVTFNQSFDRVIHACAEMHKERSQGTWIIPEMNATYCELHERGLAHSVEVWQESKLVGGMYGVYINGVFSGESMFFKLSQASKLALISLIDVLVNHSISWIDIQMVTPLTKSLGGIYMNRESFLEKLNSEKGPEKIDWPQTEVFFELDLFESRISFLQNDGKGS